MAGGLLKLVDTAPRAALQAAIPSPKTILERILDDDWSVYVHGQNVPNHLRRRRQLCRLGILRETAQTIVETDLTHRADLKEALFQLNRELLQAAYTADIPTNLILTALGLRHQILLALEQPTPDELAVAA